MGRLPTVNKNLPPRMRKRQQKSGKTYYYYDAGGKPRKEIPLGPDFVAAVRKWAELEHETTPKHLRPTFRDAAVEYLKVELPKKSDRTQRDNLSELENLYKFFDDPPALLDEIEPQHVRQYMAWRVEQTRQWYKDKGKKPPGDAGHVRANREKSLLSHIFNYARGVGMTANPNPCAGVEGKKEESRDVYIEDDDYKRLWDKADQPLRDALDLAYLTGQRVADTLRLDERDIKDGAIWLRQNKTKAKLRVQVVGELESLIERIRERKRGLKVVSTALIVNEAGQKLGRDALRYRFDKARAAAGFTGKQFQFRDLRAKAGTDKAESAGDIRQAQKQLGHRSVTMTEHYVRNRKGDKVAPTR